MPTWLTVVSVLGSVVGFSTGVAAIFVVPSQIRKLKSDVGQTNATAAETLSTASIALMAPAVDAATKLDKELANCRRLIANLVIALGEAQGEVIDLRGQVDRLSKDLKAALAENDRLKGSN